MVQTSSLALFATVALWAVSPSLGAAVPSKPVSSTAAASSTTLSSTTVSSTTASSTTASSATASSATSSSTTTSSTTTSSSGAAQAPAAAAPAWVGQEEQLLADLAALQNYFPPDSKQATNNTDLQSNADGNVATTPTPNDSELDKDLASGDPFSSLTSDPPSATSTDPASQQQDPVLQSEFKVLGDLEQLLKSQSTLSSRDFDGPETDIREMQGTWVRGYDNSQNDARDLDLNNGEWVRGYDNSQNDVRDFESDIEYAARDDELESFERDFDDDEFCQRLDFEELEDLE